MNKAWAAALQQAVQAAILGALLWASAMAFGWHWLLLAALAACAYSLIALGYALFRWWLK